MIATFALGAHQSVRWDQRPTDRQDRDHKDKELWVTHQRDNTISVLSFPKGKLLDQFSLPDGTRPHITTFHTGPMRHQRHGQWDAVNRRCEVPAAGADADLWARAIHQVRSRPTARPCSSPSFPRGRSTKSPWTRPTSRGRPPAPWSSQTGKPPVGTVFSADSQRAYVSTMMDGIAIVDVPSMTILGTLPTDGFVACGMIKPARTLTMQWLGRRTRWPHLHIGHDERYPRGSRYARGDELA